MPDHPACLIVTAAAEEFAEEIARHDPRVPVRCCPSADSALHAYAAETVLLGEPTMIGEVLQEMPTVEWVQSSWAGVTPLIRHPRRGYVLTGIKDVFGPQISEYVLGYLLAHELKLLERRAAQQTRTWFADASGVLAGKRLGIMGTGSIGRHIAKTAAVFSLTTIGLSRSGAATEGFARVVSVERLHEFLEQCDYLVSTLPDTPATDQLLDRAALRALPPHAYFVSVGRSNVVDDAALVDALRHGRLAGAAVDVFDQEPVPQDSPLWDTPGLSMTAHVAAISHPRLIAPIFIDNYRRYTQGQALRYVVNFDAGY
ncbi:MAG: D-2-hydroxyacid dehydrogenase [Acidobacteria bacterium]|nr:D-2-hydroxyacid dehydrogenase [Acidobacteriota bacterium]